MFYYTVLNAFDHAIANNGLFPVKIEYGTQKKHILETLESLFRFDFNAHFLIAPLAFSKSDNVTKLKSEYLDKYVHSTDKEFHYIDMFAIFNLDCETRDIDKLKVFESFFKMVKAQCLNHGLKYNLKMMYEPGPVRLVPYAGKSNGQASIKLEDETNEVIKFLEDNTMVNDYFCFVAKYLRNAGRWSWINIYHGTLLTPKEERPFFLKETD